MTKLNRVGIPLLAPASRRSIRQNVELSERIVEGMIPPRGTGGLAPEKTDRRSFTHLTKKSSS